MLTDWPGWLRSLACWLRSRRRPPEEPEGTQTWEVRPGSYALERSLTPRELTENDQRHQRARDHAGWLRRR
jgi:hypothetical protein